MPALPIISADERLRSHTAVKGQIWGRYGQGKTWLVRTLLTSTAIRRTKSARRSRRTTGTTRGT